MSDVVELPDATERTTCCIVGGGPAGMMLGLLLARSGVNVTVLEKHADFLRDFRGDTIHPSTLELMGELGLMGELERLPHRAVSKLIADVDGTKLQVADLGDLPGPHGHIYMLPQWDFLELLSRKAAEHPSFTLRMSAEVIEPWRERGRVAGVIYRSDGVLRRLRADLVVACDGRGSRLRSAVGARPVDLGAPMDVLWLRIPRKKSDPQAALLSIRRGRLLVLIDRDDYWQAGYVIPKGDSDRVRREGILRFVESLEQTAPLLGDGRLRTMTSFDGIGMLLVQVNQLPRWFASGVLFIGDAAHAMSPVAGVGINLAIQDAVAAARILAKPLRRHRLSTFDLARVQARRCVPALLTQIMQVAVQRWLIRRVLAGVPIRLPRYLPKLLALRRVRALIARAVGRGVRPEHWRPRVTHKTERLAAVP